MLELLKDYFKKQDWDYAQENGSTVFYFAISGENGNFNCVADLKEEENSFIFFSIAGTNTPDEKKGLMAELLIRINFDNFLGNFDLDFEDGEIRYKTSMVYSKGVPDMDWIDNLVMTNIITMDKCLPALIGLIFNDLSPIEAYNSIIEN